MRQKRNAFTLIELLVVIAIIGLLLAIMAPALKKAREQMKFLACKTNLKGYGTATKLYLSDNNDTYPDCRISVFNGDVSVPGITIPIQCQWHDRRINPEVNPAFAGPVWHYIETIKVGMCPTFKPFALTYGADHAGHNAGIQIEPQYAYSQNGFLGAIRDRVYGVLKESEVVEPGGVVVWVEETIYEIPGLSKYVLNDTCFFTRHPNAGFSSDPVANLGDCIATYHNTPLQLRYDGVGNCVFVDAHVELRDPRDKVVTAWGEISGNFRVAWPKRNKFSQKSPY